MRGEGSKVTARFGPFLKVTAQHWYFVWKRLGVWLERNEAIETLLPGGEHRRDLPVLQTKQHASSRAQKYVHFTCISSTGCGSD